MAMTAHIASYLPMLSDQAEKQLFCILCIGDHLLRATALEAVILSAGWFHVQNQHQQYGLWQVYPLIAA